MIDSTIVTIDGWSYQVRILEDDDSSLDEFTSPEEHPVTYESFARGDWRFVGIEVVPIIDGELFENASESLWSVEYGTSPDWQDDIDLKYITSIYPVPDLVMGAREKAIRIGKAIAAMPTL